MQTQNNPLQSTTLKPVPKLRVERFVDGGWWPWDTYGKSRNDLRALFEAIEMFRAEGYRFPDTLRVVEATP